MLFTKAGFIKANRPFVWDYKDEDLAPMFRKSFTVESFARAEVSFCALGLGTFYINGRKVTEDLFLSPTSDYNKTLWCSTYDVTPLLEEGENVIACILGNGWYKGRFGPTWMRGHFMKNSCGILGASSLE